MPRTDRYSHRLKQSGGPDDAEWLLEWNDETFVLKSPDGRPVFEIETTQAHRIVDLDELYAEGRIVFATSHWSLKFKKNRQTVAELRAFVETGLRSDPAYLVLLRRGAAQLILRGLIWSVVASGLFGLYCWWAFAFPDPPPETWLRSLLEWLGWLIHAVQLIVMGTALAGFLVILSGLRQWLRFRSFR